MVDTLKKVEHQETWDVRFVSALQEKFGADLWYEDPRESRELINKIREFYLATKEWHRDQTRLTWEGYFTGHVIPVAYITSWFENSTIRDVIVWLGHDFVEDHRELSYTQALDKIEFIFGPNKRWKMLKQRISNLTKFDLEDYLPETIEEKISQITWEEKINFPIITKEEFENLNDIEKQNFLQKYKKELGLFRGKKYFATLAEAQEWDVRVKTWDSIHNLWSCHTLEARKIRKTISEKEKYLLPILENKWMKEEKEALILSLNTAWRKLQQKTSSDEIKKVLETDHKTMIASRKNEVLAVLAA